MTDRMCLHVTCTAPATRTSEHCQRHARQVREGKPTTDIRPRSRSATGLCGFPGCGRPYYSNGLCRPHDKQQKRGQDLFPVGDREHAAEARRAHWRSLTPEQQRQRVANLRKNGSYARTEEWRQARAEQMAAWWKERSKTPLRQRICDACGVTYDATSWRQVWCSKKCANTVARARKFGLSYAEFCTLLKQHDGRCGICGRESALMVDHDHTTGRVRGLLCVTCNTGLGKLGDSRERLMRAIAYLDTTL